MIGQPAPLNEINKAVQSVLIDMSPEQAQASYENDLHQRQEWAIIVEKLLTRFKRIESEHDASVDSFHYSVPVFDVMGPSVGLDTLGDVTNYLRIQGYSPTLTPGWVQVEWQRKGVAVQAPTIITAEEAASIAATARDNTRKIALLTMQSDLANGMPWAKAAKEVYGYILERAKAGGDSVEYSVVKLFGSHHYDYTAAGHVETFLEMMGFTLTARDRTYVGDKYVTVSWG